MHFWWPKISGRMYPEGWPDFRRCSCRRFNLTFFPQFILGYVGMPRRYWQYPPEFQVLNVLSTAGASVLAVGLPVAHDLFLWSLKYGPIASDNPWNARRLEWKTTSPPPTFNFDETSRRNLEAITTTRSQTCHLEAPVASSQMTTSQATTGSVTTMEHEAIIRRCSTTSRMRSNRRTPPRLACGCSW